MGLVCVCVCVWGGGGGGGGGGMSVKCNECVGKVYAKKKRVNIRSGFCAFINNTSYIGGKKIRPCTILHIASTYT